MCFLEKLTQLHQCKVKFRNLHCVINIPEHFHHKMSLLLVKLLCFCTEKQIDSKHKMWDMCTSAQTQTEILVSLGFLAPSGAQEMQMSVCLSVCLMKSVLELQ